MKQSVRARRMQRHHRRNRAGASLSLTSLMDIFTILVFFLLVNSSNSQQLPDNKDIVLPESTAEQLPEEVLTIQISPNAIVVQDRVIGTPTGILEPESDVADRLIAELNTRAARSVLSTDEEREVMILAHRTVPFAVIRKVMTSATETPYSKIAFAVLRKSDEEVTQ